MNAAPNQATLERMLTAAAPILEAALAEGGVPGAALGVVSAAGGRAALHLGAAMREPETRPLAPDAWFDLASLTKVLFTLPEVLRLVEEGRLDLDDPLARHLPEAGWLQEDAPLARLTVRRLLAHQAGLPAWVPLYTWGGRPETLKARLLQERWELGAPVYSDVGYMLLGLLLERLRRRELKRFALPAGLTFAPDPERSAATERCPWRGRVLVGEVHDENAFALGGAAGHAGLFGTLDGVLDRAQAWLTGAELSPAAHAEALEPQSEERLLGWVRRHPGWSGGSLTSPAAYGHTGFTGTGVWIDPKRGYAWALLSNRVHPSRHRPNPLPDLRRAVGNALAAAWRPA
ncbi:serine hydrolase domain-containing protein [Oceanithermus desulfurans]|uniref:Esterase n=2 Tax=Oceanithermus desulfurans TaxID=227924 RepID=A0A511RJG4_9DEIN|nr:serine hydrolase domain-containing protein [Oceanithermus desulfurans]MBB6029834.1 CubicO group peptidase (beta-lactamase class C family) [Oceanithermus desulfurans]GEM89795.1 esterase [Oceanithermus desulfurans NBRC 100063]